METAKILISFFSTIVQTILKIPQYSDFDPIVQNIKDPTLKAIMKYKNHRSILPLKLNIKARTNFLSQKKVQKTLTIFHLETK